MADDEQFSLCWNNFNTNLSAGFHESLLRGDLVDVTLAAEGQLVKAHRLILSVCSPYFRKMFTQVPVNQHAFIFLKDVSHSALKDLIQFMYCGEVNVKQDALPAFISTAEALQIKGLTETGDSAPVQQSPAKEATVVPTTVSAPATTGASPRTKVQRTRVQSYKLDSEESGDDKVQIQPVSSHHVVSQQAQHQVQHSGSQKRSLQQRTAAPSLASKRTKLSVSAVEALETPETTSQVQTVQIVKQQVLDPEYVDLPIVETINAKAEPDYTEDTGEIETVETEAEQEQTLTEHDQSADQEHGDDDGNYAEDEAYGEMNKFEESYFTEGEEVKPGASGFGDSYTSDGGTGTEQSAQGRFEFIQSQRGYPLMVVNDYLFRKNRGIYWRCIRCTKHKCRARLIVQNGARLKFMEKHTHGPETAKIEHGRRVRNDEVITRDGIRLARSNFSSVSQSNAVTTVISRRRLATPAEGLVRHTAHIPHQPARYEKSALSRVHTQETPQSHGKLGLLQGKSHAKQLQGARLD